MAKTLTALSVAKLKPAAVRLEIPDAGCPGLRQRPGGVSRRLQTLQIGRKVRRCAAIGDKTAQISQGGHRFGRADGKGLGQHPSLDLP